MANVAIEEVQIPAEGRVVHLKGYGMVRVFRRVAKRPKNKDGGAEHYHYYYYYYYYYYYWAREYLRMSEEARQELETRGWGLEKRIIGLCEAMLRDIKRAQARRVAHEEHRGITWGWRCGRFICGWRGIA